MARRTSRKHWIALLLAGAGAATALAQTSGGSEIWARGYGGPGRERVTGVAPDLGGRIYTAGQVQGQATLGPAKLVSAGADALVAALAKDGAVVWAHALGGPGADEARAVAVLPEKDLFVVGSFSGTADFDPGPGRTELVSAGATDVFVLRLTPEGALVWARRLGGPQADTGFDVAVDARGVYVAGSFQGALGPDPAGLKSAGKTDGFLVKLDLAGTLQWARRIGGPQEDEARGLALETGGEVWVAGSFEEKAGIGSTADEATLESAGRSDAFLARLSPDGGLLWSGRMGGKESDAALAVTTSQTGVWVTGRFAGTADFDPGPTATSLISSGKSDTFVARLAKTGQLRWAQRTGDQSFDFGTGIAATPEGEVWALSTNEARVFGDGPEPDSADDRATLTRFDREGQRKDVRDLVGERGLRALDVALDSAGNPCVAAVFRGNGGVHTGFEAARLLNAGESDALVARIVK
jgi:hypothetical protein